jgi:hypothetical protein
MRKMLLALLAAGALALCAPSQAKAQWMVGGWTGFRPSWDGYWGAARSYWRLDHPTVFVYGYVAPYGYAVPHRDFRQQRYRFARTGAVWSRLSQRRTATRWR